MFKFLDYFSKKRFYGLTGLLMIALSFVYWYLPLNNFSLTAFNFLFYLGNILFFDFLSYNFSGSSMLHSKHQNTKLASHLLLVGALFGGMLELYGHWLGKLFYYPYWSPTFYFLILIPGYAFYSFYLIETYLGTKAVLEKIFPHKIENRISFAGLKRIFMSLGLMGALSLGAVTMLLIINANLGSNLKEFVSIINASFISRPFSDFNFFLIISVISLSVWLIMEYIEYEKRETSMLYEMIKGNFMPVISVFVSAWLSAFLYEILNLAGGLWRYQNIPFSEIALFGVPLFVYIILWPIHYFPLFSLYRILFKKDSEDMWK